MAPALRAGGESRSALRCWERPAGRIGHGLRLSGSGLRLCRPAAWVEAARLVGETLERPNFTGFVDSTAAVEQVARGVTQVAVTYSGDVEYRKAASPDTYEHLEFFVPEEGSQLGVDTLVIPARAPHPELAHAFIDFLMQPENAARSAEYAYYRTPNEAALERLPPALAESSRLDGEHRGRLVTTPLIEGDALQLLQQLWTEVRSR